MKKVLVLLAVVAMAGTAMAFHPGEDCDSCHLPHVAQTLAGMPLWSGLGIAADTVFTNYDSPSLQATVGNPQGSTLLCLGCHDISMDDTHPINTAEGDLSTTHPIEFVYDSQLAIDDRELVNPDEVGSSAKVNGKETITEDLLAGTGIMNCNSCHDVHISGRHSDGASQVSNGGTLPNGGYGAYSIPHLIDIPGIEYKLTWAAPGTPGHGAEVDDYELSYGALCTTCHIK